MEYRMEYYWAIKRNNAVCSNMDGPRDYHTKWSKSKIHIKWCCLYSEPLKNVENELI